MELHLWSCKKEGLPPIPLQLLLQKQRSSKLCFWCHEVTSLQG